MEKIPEKVPKHKNNRLKRRLLGIFSRSLETIGWIGLLYFWWEVPSLLGGIFSFLLIFSSIVIEVLIHD